MAKATSVATVAFAAVSFASVAQAQNTVLNFIGSAQVNDPNPAPGAGSTAVIDFVPLGGPTGSIGAIQEVDLTGVPVGAPGLISDLTATGSGFNAVPFLVQINGYTFTLGGANPGAGSGFNFGPIGLSQNGAKSVTAAFSVFGTVTGPGFAGTRNYNGVFTTQFSSRSIGRPSGQNISVAQLVDAIDRGTVASASYSATFDISRVPEPSTYALMASGVVMLGAFARRRRQQA